MLNEGIILDTISTINAEGLELTLQRLKGKDYEIELLEKLANRPSLAWSDQVIIEAELHERKQAELGTNSGGRPPVNGKQGWSQNDTANLLGISMGGFSQDLSLAKALKENPHLAKIKDKKTALKLVRQVTKREIAQVEALRSADNMDQILCGDSGDVLRIFPDKTFDACITDPPWSNYNDPELRSDDKTLPVFSEIFRVLKSDSFLYAVVSSLDFISYSKILPTFGFKVQDYPLIWHKTASMTHGRAVWQYARDYEPILLAIKGNPSLTSGVELSSVMQFPIVHSSKVIHPNEKPIELIEKLIRHCSYEGSKILDPFAGSGVVAEACKKLDRRFIAIERDPKRFSLIEKRMSK